MPGYEDSQGGLHMHSMFVHTVHQAPNPSEMARLHPERARREADNQLRRSEDPPYLQARRGSTDLHFIALRTHQALICEAIHCPCRGFANSALTHVCAPCCLYGWRASSHTMILLKGDQSVQCQTQGTARSRARAL